MSIDKPQTAIFIKITLEFSVHMHIHTLIGLNPALRKNANVTQPITTMAILLFHGNTSVPIGVGFFAMMNRTDQMDIVAWIVHLMLIPS